MGNALKSDEEIDGRNGPHLIRIRQPIYPPFNQLGIRLSVIGCWHSIIA